MGLPDTRRVFMGIFLLVFAKRLGVYMKRVFEGALVFGCTRVSETSFRVSKWASVNLR